MSGINQFYSLDSLFGFTHKDGAAILGFSQNHMGIFMANQNFDSVEAQASYGIGLQVGQQLLESGLEGLVPNAILAGLVDALEGNMPSVPVETLHKALREVHERADCSCIPPGSISGRRPKFLDENQKRDGVSTTESGLQFSVINQGDVLSHLAQTAYEFIIQGV